MPYLYWFVFSATFCTTSCNGHVPFKIKINILVGPLEIATSRWTLSSAVPRNGICSDLYDNHGRRVDVREAAHGCIALKPALASGVASLPLLLKSQNSNITTDIELWPTVFGVSKTRCRTDRYRCRTFQTLAVTPSTHSISLYYY